MEYIADIFYKNEESKGKLSPLDSLREIIKIQCSDGNWNANPYMYGMANGLILALSVLENISTKYLEKPDHFLDGNN